MRQLTIPQFINRLLKVRGEQTATLTAATNPPLLRDAPARLAGVIKLVDVKGVINFDYAEMVNANRRIVNDRRKFKPAERRWGHRVEGLPLVEHNGQYYLEVCPLEYDDVRYVLPNGRTVKPTTVEPHLRPASWNYRQLLPRSLQVQVRDYAMVSCTALTIGGVEYVVAKR